MVCVLCFLLSSFTTFMLNRHWIMDTSGGPRIHHNYIIKFKSLFFWFYWLLCSVLSLFVFSSTQSYVTFLSPDHWGRGDNFSFEFIWPEVITQRMLYAIRVKDSSVSRENWVRNSIDLHSLQTQFDDASVEIILSFINCWAVLDACQGHKECLFVVCRARRNKIKFSFLKSWVMWWI